MSGYHMHVASVHVHSSRMDCVRMDDARPVVVIDPEDREQVERLIMAMQQRGWTGLDDDAPSDMQAALRSLIAPPKPPEPQGLGAVVEDAEGEKWVWMSAGAQGAYWMRVGPPETWRNWSQIPAVRVLSEGVQ